MNTYFSQKERKEEKKESAKKKGQIQNFPFGRILKKSTHPLFTPPLDHGFGLHQVRGRKGFSKLHRYRNLTMDFIIDVNKHSMCLDHDVPRSLLLGFPQ